MLCVLTLMVAQCQMYLHCVPVSNVPTLRMAQCQMYLYCGPVSDVLTLRMAQSFSVGVSLMYSLARSTLTICFSVSVKDVTTPLSNPVTERA